ncbi:TlpA family protein disulfide reductase [Capilliphycus salinus ALCB114379]|uniref:TlpA family protein disulfide reductase n=1 Tax=Capilliphycus salinus TaxID=2768948 RepID=UPI0039A629D3
MKVQYLATLASISLLSFGAIAGYANPCAAKTPSNTRTEISTNPCAGANPCASKSQVGSVGAPLAEELQGKPVVVDMFATWCSACKNIAPTLTQLKKEYEGKAHFIVLDVSDQSTTAKAEAKAKQLGLGQFFAANKSQTGTVTIIDPATGNILAQHKNNPNLAAYTQVIDAAIGQ